MMVAQLVLAQHDPCTVVACDPQSSTVCPSAYSTAAPLRHGMRQPRGGPMEAVPVAVGGKVPLAHQRRSALGRAKALLALCALSVSLGGVSAAMEAASRIYDREPFLAPEAFETRRGALHRMAFLEDVTLSGILAARSMRGQASQIKRQAMLETQEKAKQDLAHKGQHKMVRQMVGPRGGLPSLKADLVRLATLLHVEVGTGDTVDIIKGKIRGPLATVMSAYKDQQRRGSSSTATLATPTPASTKSSTTR